MKTKMNRIDCSKYYPSWLYYNYNNNFKKTAVKKVFEEDTNISLNSDLSKKNMGDLTQVTENTDIGINNGLSKKNIENLIQATEDTGISLNNGLSKENMEDLTQVAEDTVTSLKNDFSKENMEDLTQVKSESSLLTKPSPTILNTKNNFDPFIALQRLGLISKNTHK